MGREREFGDFDDDDERGHTGPGQEGGEYEGIRNRGRERLKYLARPKDPKVQWWTCVGPEQTWGTQETLWPLNPATKSHSATPRVSELASPKKDFQTGVHFNRPIWQYSCGRVSALSLVDENAMKATPSDRLAQLAQHKKYTLHTPNRNDFLYSCGRVSPIWDVSGEGTAVAPRPHTVDLAHHKQTHKQFMLDRDVQWEVSKSAQTTKPSERTEQLATPKLRAEGPYGEPGWPVSEAALNSVASPRCMELARAKALADGFQHAREIEWPVSKGARRATASGRLAELANPVQRVNMNVLQFNPDAFQVKPLALKSRISNRVEELARPIDR